MTNPLTLGRSYVVRKHQPRERSILITTVLEKNLNTLDTCQPYWSEITLAMVEVGLYGAAVFICITRLGMMTKRKIGYREKKQQEKQTENTKRPRSRKSKRIEQVKRSFISLPSPAKAAGTRRAQRFIQLCRPSTQSPVIFSEKISLFRWSFQCLLLRIYCSSWW
jgi:hypothetical protein